MGQNTRFFTLDVSCGEQKRHSKKQSTRLRNHNKGGQSSARFGRLHQEKIHHYLSDIIRDIKTEFDSSVKYIVIGGCGTRKDELFSHTKMDSELKKKIIGKITLVNKDNNYICGQELDKILNLINECKKKEEDAQVREFEMYIQEGKYSSVVYGKKKINEELLRGMIKTLFVDENKIRDDRLEKIEKECSKVGCKMVKIKGISQTGARLLSQFGVAFGIRWYSDSPN